MITMDKAYLLIIVDKDGLEEVFKGVSSFRGDSVREFIDSPFRTLQWVEHLTPILHSIQTQELTQEQIDAVNAVVSIEGEEEKNEG